MRLGLGLGLAVGNDEAYGKFQNALVATLDVDVQFVLIEDVIGSIAFGHLEFEIRGLAKEFRAVSDRLPVFEARDEGGQVEGLGLVGSGGTATRKSLHEIAHGKDFLVYSAVNDNVAKTELFPLAFFFVLTIDAHEIYRHREGLAVYNHVAQSELMMAESVGIRCVDLIAQG